MSWCFKTGLQLPKGQLSFVEKWPLMNPNDVAFILIIYLVFTVKLGPLIMEARPPFQLKSVVLAYNVLRIINSAILGSKFLSYIIDNGLFSRTCQYNDNTTYTISVLYWKYMATSILDLFDTIFLIIGKKYNQVAFHHVFHHIIRLVTSWSCLKYDPSDQWMTLTLMNCAINTVLYVYDGVVAMGPSYVAYLWWKKYLIVMQMMQFVLITAHMAIQASAYVCPKHSGCYWVTLCNILLNICSFIALNQKRRSNYSKDVTRLKLN